MKRKTTAALLCAGSLLIMSTGCIQKKVDPCVQTHGCKSCEELFDRYQKNLNDPAKSRELWDCYQKSCAK